MFGKVAIVGVGLIGGSFARALREHGLAGELLGVSSARTIEGAREAGIIDRGAALEEACAEADLIFLAAPVLKIKEQLPLVARNLRAGALVTDAGSTKVEIVAAARQAGLAERFVGGHPMAGKAISGWQGAEANLFAGRPWILTGVAPESLRNCLERIGARVLDMTPEEHDRLVAFCSHLPQLLSTALGATLSVALPQDRVQTGTLPLGPGAQDMLRLATSSHELWADILSTNRYEVLAALDAYIGQLNTLRDQVGEDLTDVWTRAKETARTLRDRKL